MRSLRPATDKDRQSYTCDDFPKSPWQIALIDVGMDDGEGTFVACHLIVSHDPKTKGGCVGVMLPEPGESLQKDFPDKSSAERFAKWLLAAPPWTVSRKALLGLGFHFEVV